ncbi:MAG: MBL fold metallo-hydrolase [Paludibacteraceae bacterium]|nr:MBL fold metallo-hydrolase [Paludibacteraceae bacterium]
MTIKTFYCNPYRECTYIVEVNRQFRTGAVKTGESGNRKECIIIDPGMYGEKEEQRVLDYLQEQQLTPIAVLITHAHPDHICGIECLQKLYPNLPKIDWKYSTQREPPTIELGGLVFRIIPTPGHKEDSVCYYFENEKTLFTGDTLFQESIGRTDLPGGDMGTLIRSLETLKKLPDDTQVYPGHGYPTTIGHEKEFNPYL